LIYIKKETGISAQLIRETVPAVPRSPKRFLFTRETTCIDCHKGIAHHLPDMRNAPGWQ